MITTRKVLAGIALASRSPQTRRIVRCLVGCAVSAVLTGHDPARIPKEHA